MATIIGTNGDDNLNGIASETNHITGLAGDDVLLGGMLSDILIGGFGNDRLEGGVGDDALWGEEGNDQLFGDAGDDMIDTDIGNDLVHGGAGDDDIHLEKGLAGELKQVFAEQGDDVINAGLATDRVDGGQGIDLVSYTHSTADIGVTVDLLLGKGSGGFAEGDTYWSVEDVTGSRQDDTLVGNGAYNTIDGWLGNDTIRGGAGGDLLDGGEGVDWLSYYGSNANVVVNLETGQAVGGHAEGDTFRNFENLRGSKYGDRLSGDGGDNVIEGRQGFDQLFGHGGNDTLVGGLGNDQLWGNDGADRFDFNAVEESTRAERDTIHDFHHDQGDLIDLSGIDANSLAAGDQAFTFIGTAAFSGAAGELRYDTGGSGATVFGDVDGDGSSDLAIEVANVRSLAASDFIV